MIFTTQSDGGISPGNAAESGHKPAVNNMERKLKLDKQKLICALDDLKCAEASVRTAFEDAESEREIRARRRTSEELSDCVKRLNKLLIALNWQSMAENYDVKLFAQRLKELRKERKISLGEMAAVLGVTRQAINNYELGKTMPGVKNLTQAANFLDVSTDYLLGISQDKGCGSRPPEGDGTQ